MLHPWRGGVDPRPTLTGIERGDHDLELLLRWSGLGGPYRVERRDSLDTESWVPAGGPTTGHSLSVPAGPGTGFFRIQAPRPDYLGDTVCLACHRSAHQGWTESPHRQAFETLKRIGQGANPTCLPCHSVGYGLPGGFVSDAATPRLAGVQCESCHGPGGRHVSDPGDLTARPVVSLASMTCGGCHNDFHHPLYDDWLTSGHRAVTPSLAADFQHANPATAEARMRSCGACHSGAVRLAMLNGLREEDGPPSMPPQDHAAHTGITCAVCHTAHEKTAFGSQLRNPPHSMEFFSYSTSTNTSFALQYREDINLCGQCHNQRGARWQDTSRPPHHSPQYNVLVGDIGFSPGVARNSSHRDIAKQCTHCHTAGHDSGGPSEEDFYVTGHSFKPLSVNCAPCHTAQEAEAFVGFTQRLVRGEIARVKALLDTWGETHSPEPLRTQYGKLTWEYNVAGQLSQSPETPAPRGPTPAEQTVVPDAIKQARFLLYMVEHDGSYGVHNGMYARHLLEEAARLVAGASAD